MKTTIIYHSADFDGVFSREIARRFLDESVEYVGWNYGDAVPNVSSVELLYMIDISIDAVMDHSNLIWIDHHKSAILKFSPHIHEYRIDGVAASRLAWEWFANNRHALPLRQTYVDRRVKEPLAVLLAGEYDVGDKRRPRAHLLQHGLRSCEPDFQRLLAGDDAYLAASLENGKILQFTKDRENGPIIERQGLMLRFENLTFLACDAARFNGGLFSSGLRTEHDGCLGFNSTCRLWKVTHGVPRKPDIDFSEIAAKCGDGGHKRARGFEGPRASV